MNPLASEIQSSLSQTRRLSVAAGVLALVVVGFVPEGTLADRVAFVALAALGFAAALGWIEVRIRVRARPVTVDPEHRRDVRRWLYAAASVTLITAVAAQTWFRLGTTVGTGDIAPPNGTAWLSRVFEAWTWSGSNLGEPSQLPFALPWAGVLGLVDLLGGGPELAQRIWYTALLVAAGLGVLALIGSLGMGPVAGVVASAIYLLNPYVISEVNINPVFLAALCPLAAMPAALVAAGNGRLPVRWSAALVALQAPLIGYVFSNPPLVGMILGVALSTPLLVGWVEGRDAALRSLRALVLALPFLIAASAYWIVPAFLHLSGFASSQLASVSSWSWTEQRATIRNAFWLNNTWGWTYPEYYPYAQAYERFPRSAARFILPALAFAALALSPIAHGRDRPGFEKQLRLAIAVATGALALILLSTGTNPPGSFIFNPLYNLPFGWLLREPGRFLMIAALAYAVLIAITVEAASKYQFAIPLARLRRAALSQVRLPAVSVALATALILGFPMYTGAVVPDQRPSLPSAHVTVPEDWTQMAGFVDKLPMSGAVLVMPPDDFYQMPYTWGYYGTDSFIVDLFHRRVLVPNGQGYIATSTELSTAVNSTVQSILHGDWRQTAALVTALDTPLVLVRRDINASDPSRVIVPPSDLSRALIAAPNFVMIRQIGSLDLFALKKTLADSSFGANYVTVDTTAPDLRLLTALPAGTALVTGSPRAGVTNVVQAPAVELWPVNGPSVVWEPKVPPGGVFRIAELQSQTMLAIDHQGTYSVGTSKARITYDPGRQTGAVSVTLNARSAVADGDFTNGAWGPVGDCNALRPAQAKPFLTARVVANAAPGGAPAMELSALFDSACVAQSIDWRGGPLILSVMVNRIQGSVPRLCVFQSGPERCASLPSIPEAAGWSTYRASVTPDAGTTALTLFLYADAGAEGSPTRDQYASVRLLELPELPSFALLADQPTQLHPTTELVVGYDSFSKDWQGSIGTHVLVNGMVNGWLIPKGYLGFSAYYTPEPFVRAAQWLSLVAVFVTLLFPNGFVWAERAIKGGRRGHLPTPRPPSGSQ